MYFLKKFFFFESVVELFLSALLSLGSRVCGVYRTPGVVAVRNSFLVFFFFFFFFLQKFLVVAPVTLMRVRLMGVQSFCFLYVSTSSFHIFSFIKRLENVLQTKASRRRDREMEVHKMEAAWCLIVFIFFFFF